jgi:hypothetical protein
MNLVSESSKHADEWLDLAGRMPPGQQEGALKVAEAWFHLAMDAVVLETDKISHKIIR